MSEMDEIDERRARVLARKCMSAPMCRVNDFRGCSCIDEARAIRLSDEAAGYEIHKKLSVAGTVNEKDRKG